MTSAPSSVDSLDLRQRFDTIIAEIDAIDLQALPPEHMVGAAARIAEKIREAVEVIERLGGSPTLSAIAKFTMAETNVTLGRALHQDAQIDDALRRCDEGLALLTGLPEGEKAPLLELRARYLRGGIFAARSNFAAAVEQLREVVAHLEPHVARLRRVRASGNEADVFAVELMDRHVHAESMLEDARAMLTDLEPLVRSIAEIGRAMAHDDVGALADAEPRVRTARGRQLRNLAGMGAMGVGCFVLASFVSNDLFKIVLWMIGGFILLGSLGAMRTAMARRD